MAGLRAINPMPPFSPLAACEFMWGSLCNLFSRSVLFVWVMGTTFFFGFLVIIFLIRFFTSALLGRESPPFPDFVNLAKGCLTLPFATDALVAAYATTAYKQSPTTWAAVLDSKYPVIFPAADPQSIYAVQQYLALGGTLQERSSVSVSISTTALTQLLDHYVAARTAGVLNNSTLDFASGPETWSAYQELRAPLVITNAHSYLQDASLATNTAAGAPPTLRGKPYTLAESWFYALISKDMTRESGAWELVDWLLQPENMGTWALKAGYLPPRTKAIESWPDEAPIDFALEILAAANERPDDDTLALIGPPLGKAVRNIIRGHVNTSAAVQDVIQEISTE